MCSNRSDIPTLRWLLHSTQYHNNMDCYVHHNHCNLKQLTQVSLIQTCWSVPTMSQDVLVQTIGAAGFCSQQHVF